MSNNFVKRTAVCVCAPVREFGSPLPALAVPRRQMKDGESWNSQQAFVLSVYAARKARSLL